MKTSPPRSLSQKGAGVTTPDVPARPRKAATSPAAHASGGGMSTAERAEFVRTWKRELSQRSDATSASARSSAAAAAARTVLADRWALTQAADAKRGDRRRRVDTSSSAGCCFLLIFLVIQARQAGQH